MLAICDLVNEPALTLIGELRRQQAKLAAEKEERDPSGAALLDRYAPS